jgi:hypothetical protein
MRQQHLPIPSDKTEVFYVYSFWQIILRLIYRSNASEREAVQSTTAVWLRYVHTKYTGTNSTMLPSSTHLIERQKQYNRSVLHRCGWSPAHSNGEKSDKKILQ